MKELKNTAYRNLTATVIASRDQLCMHQELNEKSNTEKILMCKEMMESVDGKIRSDCEYYENLEENYPQLNESITKITDIEDLGDSFRREHGCCPYFFARKRSTESDIIFIPYGYLIDPIVRKANDIDLGLSVVILDEAHNVNRVCEDSASASVKDTEISAAIRDLNSVILFTLFDLICI